MNRILRSCVPVLCAGLLPLFYAAAQSAPAAPPSGPPPGGRAPYVPKNLKVLPDNADLRTIMRGYEAALGVECEYCHTPPDPVTHRPDRASDANPMKDKARTMIQMTDDINKKYLVLLADRHDADQGAMQNQVTCGTCHRGEKHPPAFVPPPHPEGGRRPGNGAPGGPPPSGMAMPTPPAGQ